MFFLNFNFNEKKETENIMSFSDKSRLDSLEIIIIIIIIIII